MSRFGSTRRSPGNKNKIVLRTRRGTKKNGGGSDLLYKVFGVLIGASILAFKFRHDHLSLQMGDSLWDADRLQADLKGSFFNSSSAHQIARGSGSAQHNSAAEGASTAGQHQQGAVSNGQQGRDIQRLGAAQQNTNDLEVNANNNPPLTRVSNTMAGPVHLLDESHLAAEDFLSASWLASKQTFMAWTLEAIDLPVHAYTHRLFGEAAQLRMPLNFLDWSVENYDRFFEVSRIWSKMNPFPFDMLSKKFNDYIARGMTLPDEPEPRVFGKAIAVIPFEHFRTNADISTMDRMHSLTVITLATCVESLRRAGFGRVVVVGLEDDDESTVQQAFAHLAMGLSPQLQQQQQGKTFVTRKIGHLEVAFVRGSAEQAKTSQSAKNIPRAALMGLKEAFQGAAQLDANTLRGSSPQAERINAWLGTSPSSSWQYIYITETDCILNSRSGAFQKMSAAVDAGMILIPHRLQPIPWERDVVGMNPLLYVPARDEFQNPIELDATAADVCCDEVKGHNYRPGVNDYPECQTFWWICGLSPVGNVHDKFRHARLQPYGLMKLAQGTGVILVAGTSHGRRCIPKKNSVCELPAAARRPIV